MRRMFFLLLNVNICLVLDELARPEYRFSKRQPDAPGVPDFPCHYFVESLILVIEVKRKHVMENISRVYQADEKGKNGDSTNLQLYGEINVDTVFDNHWFLRREHTELWISKTPLQSVFPPELKAYAYITRQANAGSWRQ
ncbi:hypothetical protein RirG_251560 [Rhizophagus irregularis DAOM 197198w]|uniref:Uncharacterized protein n=1 Tax=Rhizophagus irregularis (strain DAOM 197198w) TaxID=1432141 RepID=A0A015IF43_RHIIW|nr:hypothetical protein RirG_251560 [Rhizophagus irregularis DAOM 197198w]